MKKKITFLSFFVALTFGKVMAQPVVTLAGSGTAPINGKLIGFPITGTFTHLASGANLTWNYANVAKAEELFYYQNTPYANLSASMKALYPDGNIVSTLYYQGNYISEMIFKKTDKAEIMIGQGTTRVTPADTQLVFPHAYLEPHAGNKYDAYGTLTTPFGTFNNVIRMSSLTSDGKNTNYTFYTFGPYTMIHMTYDVENSTSKISDAYFFKSEGGVANVDELNSDMVSVYPNPSNGSFTIDWKGLEADVVITNINGQLVKSTKIQNNLTFDSFEKGIYFITIKNEDKSITKTLTIN